MRLPRLTDWPLLLAGPIVSRVEPTRVAVWVALKEPRAVRLSVFNAPVDTGPGTALFGDASPLMVGHARTLRVGENLHVAVVQAGLRQSAAPGTDLRLQRRVRRSRRRDVHRHGRSQVADSAARLSTGKPPGGGEPDEDAAPPKFEPPHLALGYEAGLLPTFVLPPARADGAAHRARVVPSSACPRPRPDAQPRRSDRGRARSLRPSARSSCFSPATRSTPTMSRRRCCICARRLATS